MKPASPKEVIQQTLAKAHENLATAQHDFDGGFYDGSVSRSYYAVFHAMTATLFSKGLHFSRHGQVIGAFNREFIKTGIFPKSFRNAI